MVDSKLIEADRILSEHFTAAIGAKAQRYEPSVTGGESVPEDAIMAAWSCAARSKWVAIGGVIAELGPPRRELLLVYAYGTDSLSAADDENGRPLAGKPSGLIVGKNNAPDPHGLLRLALTPSWGHGSFLRLAVGQTRALRSFGKRYPGKDPTHDAVLDYLAWEAGKGKESEGLMASIVRECEEVRSEALRVFADRYGEHLRRAKEARSAAEREEAVRFVPKVKVKPGRRTWVTDLTEEQREKIRRMALAVGAVGST